MARLDNAHKQLLRRALGTWPPSCLAGEDTSIIGRVTKAGRPVRPTRSLPVWQEDCKGRAEWPVPQPHQKSSPQLRDYNNGNDNNAKCVGWGCPLPSIILLRERLLTANFQRRN